MKIRTFCSILSVLFITVSCSPVPDMNDRWLDAGAVIPKRFILVEDFTGQKCVNCPNGTEILNRQMEIFHDSVIVVAVHSGPFGVSGTKGLVTDEGTEYWNARYDSQTPQPTALFDRVISSSDFSNWGIRVAEEISNTPSVLLTLGCEGQGSSFDIKVQGLSENVVNAKLQLWLVEDGIVAAQQLADGSLNKSYVHNHVLRQAINGTWGEDITFNDGSFEKTVTFQLDETRYKKENCSVVGFIYTDEDGVLNVQKVNLLNKSY